MRLRCVHARVRALMSVCMAAGPGGGRAPGWGLEWRCVCGMGAGPGKGQKGTGRLQKAGFMIKPTTSPAAIAHFLMRRCPSLLCIPASQLAANYKGALAALRIDAVAVADMAAAEPRLLQLDAATFRARVEGMQARLFLPRKQVGPGL